MLLNKNTQQWLVSQGPFTQNAWAILAAFGTYFCMYAYRKPFAVGTFEGLFWLGMDFKILLILSQVAGYTLSKFAGIKIISEMPPHRRIWTILLFIAIAEFALLLFAVVPYPFNAFCLFLNGLPLGMIWGLVFSFVEGRRYTELLGAGLCASFIVSSGVAKSTGQWLMISQQVPEFWMPFATGLVFTIPLLMFVWMLSVLPAPTPEDQALRTVRQPMSGADRQYFIKTLGVGLLCLIVFHMALTAYRDFRDNFSIEILEAIGFADEAANLSRSEVVIAFLVLISIGMLYRIKSNIRALQTSHTLMLAGVATSGFSTFLFSQGWLHGYVWYILVGLGLYLAYVPIQCMYFDRLIAVTQHPGNAGFLIYIADFTGYLAAVMILLYKNFWASEISWINFFIFSSYLLSLCGVFLILPSMFFYANRYGYPNLGTRSTSQSYASNPTQS